MIVIRKDQQEQLAALGRIQFFDKLEIHIEKFFPDHAINLDKEQRIALFEYGLERGKKYDFISERNVCLFIDLMLAFGLEFDISPDHGWAKKILADSGQNHPNVKMDALHEAGMNSLKQQF